MRIVTLFLCAVLASNIARAETPVARWVVMPEASEIRFTATQNHAPVQGKFKHFEADIHFDAEQLNQSSIKAEVDITSVDSDYEEVSENLKEKEWFAADVFPKAIFETSAIRHIEGNRYEADGTLTLRDTSLPAILAFTLDIADNIATVVGKTSLKRTQFGIGQGEWKDTSVVEDDVAVEIRLKAKRSD